MEGRGRDRKGRKGKGATERKGEAVLLGDLSKHHGQDKGQMSAERTKVTQMSQEVLNNERKSIHDHLLSGRERGRRRGSFPDTTVAPGCLR